MRVLGWLLFASTCVLFLLQGAFVAASNFPMTSREVLVDQAFPLLGIGAIVGAGVGALIVSRYPRNLIGWLLLIGQLGSAVGLASEAFRILAVQGVVTSALAGQIATYLHDVFGATFLVAAMAVIFMIAPDGVLLSRRWRPAVAVPIAALVLRCVAIVLTPADVYLPGSVERMSSFVELVTLASFSLMLLSISLGAVALVLRLRRSTGRQHLQLRWISTSAAILAVTFVLYALSDVLLRSTPWILPEATCLAYIFFSVSVGVAIFRYRLYDIDVILSRAITLGILVAFVTVGYIAVVVAVGFVLVSLGAPASISYWPSLLATALVAVAFQPVRQSVLRLADQLVYGSRAVPYEALATLSRRLADSPSPDALPASVAEAMGRAVGAACVSARIGKTGEPSLVRSSTWYGTGITSGSLRFGVPALVLPVQYQGDQVGSIEVTMPPGRALRTFEKGLLVDAAAQAGVAFRNALWEAELVEKVKQGQAQSVELSASRRRLLSAEDDARERLAGAIRRNVVPHLATIDAELTADPNNGRYLPGQLEPLICATERALQELRGICRGVFPALLDRRGLVSALSAQLHLTHPHALLDVNLPDGRRFDPAVEAAGYLFCLEVAPTDRGSIIKLTVCDDQLVASVSGDINGANDVGHSKGKELRAAWQHSRDRVAALDGAVDLQRDDSGMTAIAVIPLNPQWGREPAMAANNRSADPE